MPVKKIRSVIHDTCLDFFLHSHFCFCLDPGVGIGCFFSQSRHGKVWAHGKPPLAPKDVVPKVGHLTCLSRMTVRAINPDDLPWR